MEVVVAGLLSCIAAIVWDRQRALKAAGRQLEERTRALVHDREELAAANGRAHRLAAVVRSSDDAIFAKSLTGTILEWNPAAERIYGWSAAEIVGQPVSLLVPPERAGELDGIVDRINRGQRLAPFETVRVRKDGQLIDVAVTVSPVLDLSGQVVGASTISRDITVQKRAERALRQSEERFRLSFENASIGMALVAPDGRFLRVNRALCNIVGMSEWTLLNTTFQTITHPDDLDADLELVRQMLAGEIRTYTMEKRYVHARRHVVWINLSVSLARDNDGRPLHFISQITDITPSREAERSRQEAVAALAHAAVHDALTGLPNRVLLADRLDQALLRSSRSGTPVAVLFLDLDRFKLINDSLGHAAGDQVLVTATERLEAAIRSGDTVARFGGDEFVVVAEQHVGSLPAAALAERLNAVLSEPFTVEGSEVFLSASIGIAFGRGGESTVEGLLRDADAAMYRAKEGGRARVEFFDEPMRSEAAGRLELQNALHRAVDRGELRLLYQPIVDLASSRLVGVEALIRWRHPDLGLLGPSSFIPLAEDAGLIVPIGEWLIAEAARLCARWQPHGLFVSVNLSARQLRQPDLVGVVGAAVRNASLPPGALRLELTESVLMEDLELHGRTLSALQDLGVSLAIDDFGTGYSSLTYLRRFPVRMVKIDRSFVAGLGRNLADSAIVDSVIKLAHALDLEVVAEGTETREQVDCLRDLGCDKAQGFYFAAPGPAEAIDALLATGRPGHAAAVVAATRATARSWP